MNYLNIIKNKNRIQKLFKYMLKTRENLYLIQDIKVPISIIKITDNTLEIKISDGNYYNQTGEMIICSQYKNIEFKSLVKSSEAGHIIIQTPREIMIRDLRLVDRDQMIINDNILDDDMKINFRKQINRVKESKKIYNKKMIDISDRGFAVILSVLEPDIFEIGDILNFKLPEELVYKLGQKFSGIIKKITFIEQDNHPEHLRVWVDFQSA
ncbi:MAG: hypothetical protein HOJ35_06880 [Bdellovibrionales bacterium]|nr:hypothetical protein [Bdellovibrionales bacterium]